MKKENTNEDQQVVEKEIEATTTNTSIEESAQIGERDNDSKIVFSSTRFGIVTLILAVIGIAISVDSLVKLNEWSVGLQTVKDQIEHHLEIEKHRLDNLESALKDIDARQAVFDQKLNTYHETASVASASMAISSVDTLWQLQKAYDWLQEATLNLSWSDDWQGAIRLLQSANEIMSQLKITALQPVQAALSGDITALLAVQPVDDIALLEKIKQMLHQVVLLPTPDPGSSKKLAVFSEEKSSSGWRATVNRCFEWLQKVVVITSSESSQMLPQVQSRRILNENLMIELQQTQWALLKKDNVLFQWNVKQIQLMMRQNSTLIDLHAPQTLLFMQNLNELEKQNIAPTLPDIQPVCQQLKAYIDTLTPSMERVA